MRCLLRGARTTNARRAGASLVVALAVALAACAGADGGGSDARLQALTAAVRSRPVVLLGEVHDNAAQHALRARALHALVASGARPALLMEQFDRERQDDIDRALARPGATADDVIAAGAPPGSDAARGWQWTLHRPYVELALEHRLPLVAANVSRADARRVVAGGLAALGFDDRVPDDIAEAQARAVAEGHCGLIDVEAARPLALAQVARDRFMAGLVESHAARGAMLLAGNGHVRTDIGVPRWLAPQTRARSVAIGLLEDEAAPSAQGQAPAAPSQHDAGAMRAPRADPGAARSASPPYDVTIATPGQRRPDPCEGLRVPR